MWDDSDEVCGEFDFKCEDLETQIRCINARAGDIKCYWKGECKPPPTDRKSNPKCQRSLDLLPKKIVCFCSFLWKLQSFNETLT